MNRWKSYRLWVAILGLVGMLLKDFGLMKFIEDYSAYVNIILSILIFSGIIDYPKDQDVNIMNENEVRGDESQNGVSETEKPQRPKGNDNE